MSQPTSAQVRAVDVDTMRAWYRDLCDQSSLRQVAPLCGVGHTTLHNFLSGAVPHPRVRRLLALKYLRETGTGIGAEAASVDALLEPFDPEIRATGRRAILAVLAGLYEQGGQVVPGWITRELGEAD
jgi:hypothetical protein